MSVRIAIACGEVAWERRLLAAAADAADTEIAKRYVDVSGLERDASAGVCAPVVILSPALRGFAEKPVLALARCAHVVVLLDSIRPPWLDSSGLDCRQLDACDFVSLFDELAALTPVLDGSGEEPTSTRSGVVTAVMGVGGGVGTSTVALLHATARSGALLIDLDTAHPALGFMLGLPATASGLNAVAAGSTDGHPPVVTLTAAEAGDLSDGELLRLLDSAAGRYQEVVVDCGAGSTLRESILLRADRIVLVAPATPLGMVRLCTVVERLPLAPGGVAVVLNRARESAVGSSHWSAVLQRMVERELGIGATLVADAVPDFDRAWLRGQWTELRGRLPALCFGALPR